MIKYKGIFSRYLLKWGKDYWLAGFALAIAILGARLQSIPLLYLLFGVIVLIVVLVVFDKIESRKYPIFIFCVSLGLLYQVTLMSNYLIGSDIHFEYWWAYRAYTMGFWEYEAQFTYNTAAVTSCVFPFISRALDIPLVWMFKVIPPLFLAGTTVIIYHIFKQQILEKGAFIAVFFFVIVPTFSLELTGIAKQQIAEFFFVLFFFILIDRKLNLGIKRRTAIMIVATMLVVVTHYTILGAFWYYSVLILFMLLVMRFIPHLRKLMHFPLKVYTLIVIIGVVLGVSFFGTVGGGRALTEVVNRGVFQFRVVQLTVQKVTGNLIIVEQDVSESEEVIRVEDKQEGSAIFKPKDPVVKKPLFERYEPTMKGALGLDFPQASIGGKIFRILQYLTQLLLVVGCVLMIKNRKRFSAEYLAFAGAGGILLTICVFLPTFSPILNATRFYHIALISLAPALVLGGKALFRNYKVLVLGLLIPYFIFTSGVVFEVTKSENIDTLDMPYSYSLSGVRTSVVGVFSDADAEAREWMNQNEVAPIYGDMWGIIFMVEEWRQGIEAPLSRREDLKPFKSGVYPTGSIDLELLPVRQAIKAVPSNAYIFLREWNGLNHKIVRFTGIGIRQTITYEEAGMDALLEGRELVFQSGEAKVYSPRSVDSE